MNANQARIRKAKEVVRQLNIVLEWCRGQIDDVEASTGQFVFYGRDRELNITGMLEGYRNTLKYMGYLRLVSLSRPVTWWVKTGDPITLEEYLEYSDGISNARTGSRTRGGNSWPRAL